MAESTRNASAQQDVVPNLDPALDKSRVHHNTFAEKARQDDIIYSTGTTGEKSMIPDPDPNDDALHRRHHPERHADQPAISKEAGVGMEHDEEKGAGPTSEEDVTDPQRHTIARLYRRYRIFVHMFIWFFFTG